MAEINQLSSVDTLSSSDLMVIFSNENGDARKATLNVLAEFLQQQLSSAGLLAQYAAPGATGFSIAVAPVTDGASVHLLIKPAAAYAAGTVILPAKAASVHGQEVVVTSTQAVTVLTVSGNGSVVNGAPASLATNGFFRLRYDGIEQAWFRVG